MNKFFSTFWLTYWKKVSSKSFLISSLITILLIAGLSNFDKIIDFFDNSEKEITAVYSKDKAVAEGFKENIKALEKKRKVEVIDNLEKGKKAVLSEKYKMLLDIDVKKDSTLRGTVYGTDSADPGEMTKLQSILSSFQSAAIAKNLKLTPEQLQKVTAQAEMDNEILVKNNDKDINQDSIGINKGIIYVGSFLIFMITMTYGSQIATEIAQEKTSRIIEMIVTSVSPITHLFAKILGILAVAFTNVLIIGLAILACIYIFKVDETLKNFDVSLTSDNYRTIIYAVIFLLLGLVMYICFSAIVGSLTNRIEDIGQAIMPVTFMNIIAFYIVIFSLGNQDSTLVKVTSYIPFFTPQVMLLRASSTKTSDMTIIIGIVICIVTIVLLMLLAARIYKGSVFSYEKGLVKNFRKALQMK